VHGVSHASEAYPDFSFGLFNHIFIKNDDADLLGHGHRHNGDNLSWDYTTIGYKIKKK
jgi:hypothetical protein